MSAKHTPGYEVTLAMSKSTPGPWRAERTPASAYFDWTVVAPSGKGRVMQIGVDTDNTEADARLIAAAPDMLALLQETLQPGAYGIGSTLAERIQAAIRKATGEQP